MKRLITATVLATGISVCQASLNWSSTVGRAIVDTDGTPLFAGTNLTGYFAQLIRDVGGDGPDPISNLPGTGVTDDDVVVDVSFFGSFTGSGVVNGQLNPQGTGEPHVDGARYFVRYWNAVSAQAAGGTIVGLGAGNENTPIPLFDSVTGINAGTGKTLRYGNSEVFTATGNATTPLTYAFSASGTNAFTTNIAVNVVPEPTTAGLLGLGLVGLRMAVRRRRQS